jgi:Fe-S-cluster-containing hydrogenase component 2
MNFKVDKQKCINCKLCSKVCPVLIIDSKTDFPVIKNDKAENCLKCQHCLAVCPVGAISIWGKDPQKAIAASSPVPDSVNLESLMKIRRSIRFFTESQIDSSLIYRLISAASYAPTAKNDNAVQFTVVDNKLDMSNLCALAYTKIQAAINENRLADSHLFLADFLELWQTKNIDILFRNAPHLVITSAPADCALPQTDCIIAMTYFDLLANTNGIGTLWNGFVQSLFEEVIPDIKSVIQIPENHKISAVLLFGEASIKYARSVLNDKPLIKKIHF